MDSISHKLGRRGIDRSSTISHHRAVHRSVVQCPRTVRICHLTVVQWPQKFEAFNIRLVEISY